MILCFPSSFWWTLKMIWLVWVILKKHFDTKWVHEPQNSTLGGECYTNSRGCQMPLHLI